ncbi:MAG: hypothetical protein KTR19_08185 [Hyphomicrobiales bacterium]|nr:hypothetical protein [Hyphomicrobiales bacterium]
MSSLSISGSTQELSDFVAKLAAKLASATHSLRVGYASSAALADVSEWKIRKQDAPQTGKSERRLHSGERDSNRERAVRGRV